MRCSFSSRPMAQTIRFAASLKPYEPQGDSAFEAQDRQVHGMLSDFCQKRWLFPFWSMRRTMATPDTDQLVFSVRCSIMAGKSYYGLTAASDDAVGYRNGMFLGATPDSVRANLNAQRVGEFIHRCIRQYCREKASL